MQTVDTSTYESFKCDRAHSNSARLTESTSYIIHILGGGCGSISSSIFGWRDKPVGILMSMYSCIRGTQDTATDRGIPSFLLNFPPDMVRLQDRLCDFVFRHSHSVARDGCSISNPLPWSVIDPPLSSKGQIYAVHAIDFWKTEKLSHASVESWLQKSVLVCGSLSIG